MRKVAIGPIVAILITALPSAIAATGVDGSYNCSSTSACFSASQSGPSGSSGAGFHGSALYGPGVRGNSTNEAGILGQSASGSLLYPGIDGEVTTTNGSESTAGGFGLTSMSGGTAPVFGVQAYGSDSGVFGQVLGTGHGIEGYDATAGSNNLSPNVGVEGSTQTGTGIMALNAADRDSGIQEFQYGIALQALNFASGGTTANFTSAGDTENVISPTYLEILPAAYDDQYGDQVHNLIDGYNEGTGLGFAIDQSGNESLSGALTTKKGMYARTRGSSGNERIAYSTRSTAPSLDDVGGGQLVNGSAYIRLDPALADSIDPRVEYRVFVTPQGDSNQLYVTQKSPAGFAVREAHGGRSTIAFDYRIVAKPVDEDGRRLATAPIQRPIPSHNRRFAHTHVLGLQALTPQQRFEQMVGPAKYAQALAEFKREQR